MNKQKIIRAALLIEAASLVLIVLVPTETKYDGKNDRLLLPFIVMAVLFIITLVTVVWPMITKKR